MLRSRFFTGIDGQEYYWKPGSRRFEVSASKRSSWARTNLASLTPGFPRALPQPTQCFDRYGGVLAVYEYLMEDTSYAKMDVKPLGVSLRRLSL